MVLSKYFSFFFLFLNSTQVKPPAKWKARKSSYTAAFENLVVHAPIEQNVQGKSGKKTSFFINNL